MGHVASLTPAPPDCDDPAGRPCRPLGSPPKAVPPKAVPPKAVPPKAVPPKVVPPNRLVAPNHIVKLNLKLMAVVRAVKD